MPDAREIRKFAAEIGRHAKKRSIFLKHELADIKTRKAEIEAHLHSATLLRERLARFQAEIDGRLQCPRCWVDREMRSSLAEASGTEEEDGLRCHKCGFDLSIRK
jgi:hypothetical protein